jgi:hypothetical protein
MFGCTVKRNIVNTNVYKTKISVAATLLYPRNNETAKRRFPTTLRSDDACHAGKRLIRSIQDIPRIPQCFVQISDTLRLQDRRRLFHKGT